jgi:hypothetical protein
MAASCATPPATLIGPTVEIPVFASDDERVGTAGFVGQTLRRSYAQNGVTYTLMAFAVGDTLTLGAMVKGGFAGDVRWQVGPRTLTFVFDTNNARAKTPVRVSDDPNADLEGQGAAFAGISWMNVDVPLSSFASGGTAVQLKFRCSADETVTLPNAGHHYVMLLAPRTQTPATRTTSQGCAVAN